MQRKGVEGLKTARQLLTKAAKLFDLPLDIAANLPHIELFGFEMCSLDCHRAIIAYEPEKIIVAVNTGEVTIEGANLELRHMHRDRLTVTGTIEAMSFTGASCGS